jgi:hypothetical protein
MSHFRCIVCSMEFNEEDAAKLSLCPICYSANPLMPVEWDAILRLNWSEILLLCDAVRQLQALMGPQIPVDTQQAFRAVVARLAKHYPAPPQLPLPVSIPSEDEAPVQPVLVDMPDPPNTN